MMVLSVVVLPAPLRPTRQTTSRARTSSETRLRIWLVWMKTSRSWTASIWTCPLTLPSPPMGERDRFQALPLLVGGRDRFQALPPFVGERDSYLVPSPLWGEGQGEGRGDGLRPCPPRAGRPGWRRGWRRPAPCPGEAR